MPFRLESITLDERMELGMLCLLCAGEYGLITDLARHLDVSRQFLYTLRHRTEAALGDALSPKASGPSEEETLLTIDGRDLERAVLILSQVTHASVRSIQEAMKELLGVDASVGWIQGILTEAARRARALPEEATGPVDVDADELFAGNKPVLGAVDPVTGRILALEGTENRDGTTWGCLFLDLAKGGTAIERMTADGGTGLRAGAQAAGLPDPKLDHWHTLRDLGRIGRSLESDADRKLREWEQEEAAVADREYREAHGASRRGHPRKRTGDREVEEAAREAAEKALDRAEGTKIVLTMVKEALRPLDVETGRIHGQDEVEGELRAAVGLLREIGGKAGAAASLLAKRIERLVSYLGSLAEDLAGPRRVLGESAVGFLAWAWRHRKALGLTDATEAGPYFMDAARAVWRALDRARRGSGMAENLNSVLAFARATHRGLPEPILAVTKVYRNHRVFTRGKRAGQSPQEASGLASPHWLEVLGYGREPRSEPRTSIKRLSFYQPTTVNTRLKAA
jgi:hypothetical protein